MTTRAAVYARKSQSQEGVSDVAKSVTRQIEGARAFIEKMGWHLEEDHVYQDDGVSGALLLGRPGFQRMLGEASSRAFDVVVLFDTARFSRADPLDTLFALRKLGDCGVTVWDYSIGRAIDVETDMGGLTTHIEAFAVKLHRDNIRQACRATHRGKAARGEVTGNRVYGYRNVKIHPELEKSAKKREVLEPEADVVRRIYREYAEGASVQQIVAGLNRSGVPIPRRKRSRKRSREGWIPTTVRAILRRPLYRGEIVYGRTKMAYGKELGAARRTCFGTEREEAQLWTPEGTWVRTPAPHLRLVDPDVASRVDARLAETARRWASVAQEVRTKAAAHANASYLLTGGLLTCARCGGPYESQSGSVYACANRRRKHNCTNGVLLPIPETDDAFLSALERKILSPGYIEELLALAKDAEADPRPRLEEELTRAREGREDLLALVRKRLISQEDAEKELGQAQTEIARLEAELRRPRPVRMTRARLRAALEQRTREWREVLRDPANVHVARTLLRRLLGPAGVSDEGVLPEWMKEPGAAPPADGGPLQRVVITSVAVNAGVLLDGIAPGVQPEQSTSA